MLKKALVAFRTKFAKSPAKRAEMYRSRGISMGSGCTIFGGVGFGSEPYLVRLGDRVRITAGVQFVTHDGGMHVLRNIAGLADADLFGPIRVGSNVFIGIRSIIMPGVRIGDNVVIGAGSIVTKDIPSNTVAAGVPCRVLRSLDDYRDQAMARIDKTKALNPDEKRRYLLEKYSDWD